MLRKSDPAIKSDAYLDEAIEAVKLLHEGKKALLSFHFELMRAGLDLGRKTFHQSDLNRLHKLFDAAAAE